MNSEALQSAFQSLRFLLDNIAASSVKSDQAV